MSRIEPLMPNGPTAMFDQLDNPADRSDVSVRVPHNIEAEAGLLGALLIDGSAWSQVQGRLQAGDFFVHAHRLVFAVMASMLTAGEAVDAIAVHERLLREGVADEVGGMPFVHSLKRYDPSPAHIEHYVQSVRQCAARRAAMAEHDRAIAGLSRGDAISLRGAADAAQRAAHIVQPDGQRGVVFPGQLSTAGMPPFVSCQEFIAQYEPAVPVFESLACTAQRRVVLLTGRTHHGKTSLFALQQVCIAHGLPFAGKPTTQGRVLVFCGENPEDYRLHLAATLLHLGLDPDAQRDIVVVPGRFDIGACNAECKRRVAALDGNGVHAVFIDTSASYFNGDDDKDNMQMYQHASDLRSLARLPGEPLVCVACHPVKGAERDKLVPRGGGAFLNELDANLTVWKDAGSDTIELSWCEKLRAPSFEPMTFELCPVRLPCRFDTLDGQPMFSVAAEHASAGRTQQLEDEKESDQVALLRAFAASPGASLADLAKGLNWTMGKDASPAKVKVGRMLDALKARGLLKHESGALVLTPTGKKAVGRSGL